MKSKKILLFFILLGILFCTAACSKETALLEEDIVREDTPEGGQEETELTAQRAVEAVGLQDTEQVEESTLFVHICGEVADSGVYELPTGSRIHEAVEAAGGFTEAADESYVNLAQLLEDGCQIRIPAVGEEMLPEWNMEQRVSGNLIDINTASKSELCSLPGVGESRAESIIAYREENGSFSKIEDIMKVEGIKDGMFSKMKDKICVRGVR